MNSDGVFPPKVTESTNAYLNARKHRRAKLLRSPNVSILLETRILIWRDARGGAL